MSEDTKKGMISSIYAELHQEKIKAARSAVKGKMTELFKAREVVARIEGEIIDIVTSVGEGLDVSNFPKIRNLKYHFKTIVEEKNYG